MKFILGFILIPLFIPYPTMTQEGIEFNIVFGKYFNDHYKKEFKSVERKWILKDGRLTYFIDANNTRYSDSILLNKSDIQSITRLLNDSKLDNSIIKDMSKNYLNKMGQHAVIKGNIYFENKDFEFNIKANSESILDKDLDAQRLKKIEDLLYKIIEAY